MIKICKVCLENEVSLDLYLHVVHTASTNFNRQLTFILAINLTKLQIKFLTGKQENRYTGGIMKILRKPLSLNIELSSCRNGFVSLQVSNCHQRLTSSLNRYRRGLETCVQATTSKSGHAIFFSFIRRVRATRMTQRRVKTTRVHFWTFSPVSVKI